MLDGTFDQLSDDEIVAHVLASPFTYEANDGATNIDDCRGVSADDAADNGSAADAAGDGVRDDASGCGGGDDEPYGGCTPSPNTPTGACPGWCDRNLPVGGT